MPAKTMPRMVHQPWCRLAYHDAYQVSTANHKGDPPCCDQCCQGQLQTATAFTAQPCMLPPTLCWHHLPTHACCATKQSLRNADVSGATPAPSSASGALSAAPTGFSSDARRVVASLAAPWQDGRLDPNKRNVEPQGHGHKPQSSPKGYVLSCHGACKSCTPCMSVANALGLYIWSHLRLSGQHTHVLRSLLLHWRNKNLTVNASCTDPCKLKGPALPFSTSAYDKTIFMFTPYGDAASPGYWTEACRLLFCKCFHAWRLHSVHLCSAVDTPSQGWTRC